MYLGDIRLGDTLDMKFCTVNTSGVPTTLLGSPAVAAYPDNSTTEIGTGITLTVDFDARTGLNNVRIVATGGNGFAVDTNYALVLTAGTVGGSAVAGYVVGSFSIEKRPVALVAQSIIDIWDSVFTELVSVPSETPKARETLMLLYMTLRNKLTVSQTQLTIHNNVGTALGSKLLSDDGVIYIEQKMT